MDIQDAIRRRVSVKEYLPDPVPRGTIEALLELAVLAPNHRMTQPLAFRILGEGPKRVYGEVLGERKAGKIPEADVARRVRDRVLRRHLSVPTMVAVLVREDEDPEVREDDFATAFMAIQNFCLAAVAEGLGTHIKTGAALSDPRLRAELATESDQRVAAIVFLGQPAELPDPKPRLPAAQRTLWLDDS